MCGTGDVLILGIAGAVIVCFLFVVALGHSTLASPLLEPRSAHSSIALFLARAALALVAVCEFIRGTQQPTLFVRAIEVTVGGLLLLVCYDVMARSGRKPGFRFLGFIVLHVIYMIFDILLLLGEKGDSSDDDSGVKTLMVILVVAEEIALVEVLHLIVYCHGKHNGSGVRQVAPINDRDPPQPMMMTWQSWGILVTLYVSALAGVVTRHSLGGISAFDDDGVFLAACVQAGIFFCLFLVTLWRFAVAKAACTNVEVNEFLGEAIWSGCALLVLAGVDAVAWLQPGAGSSWVGLSLNTLGYATIILHFADPQTECTERWPIVHAFVGVFILILILVEKEAGSDSSVIPTLQLIAEEVLIFQIFHLTLRRVRPV
eukprot:TRINITY_DN6353_c0_g1_i5.p1 TRINITY_DN6353_c0_g1~~TRINITY_DN6353_c0_g1_i5.p1  ORF type:complete len:373 (+),score=85.93 TRINITY_DN6353_c0_g1_i5:443-1561(+)